MPFYKIEWPSELGEEHWGQHTEWVIRAPNMQTAVALAHKDVTNDTAELEVEEIPLEGPTEIILWYGPDA